MAKDPRFGFLGKGVFLNHASVSPPCRAARRAVHEAVEGFAREDDRFVHSRHTSGEAREAFARFVSSRLDRVMCFPNTSAALSSIAWGLRWRRGDEVLVSPYEFVSNVLAWQIQSGRGVRVRSLPTRDEWIDPDDLRKAITERTRVVAVSAVHWATGAKQDLRALAEVAHEAGAFLVVDAAQSLGAARHSARADRYDALATNTCKWLLSVNGTAFADLAPALSEEMDLPSVGWLSVAGEPEPTIRAGGEPHYRLGKGVEKLLGGAPSALSNIAVAATLPDLEEYGQERAEHGAARAARHVMDWADRLGIPVVTPRDAHAGIVALRVKHPERAVASLRKKGFRLGSRGGYLRVSPHFYTKKDEIDTFGEALRRVAHA